MDDLDLDTIERLRRTAVRDLRMAGETVDEDTLGDAVRRAASDERLLLTSGEEDALVRRVLDEALGLGPLEAAMRDPDVTEIMVCGPAHVWLDAADACNPARCGSRTTGTCCTSSTASSARWAAGSTRPAPWWTHACATARG